MRLMSLTVVGAPGEERAEGSRDIRQEPRGPLIAEVPDPEARGIGVVHRDEPPEIRVRRGGALDGVLGRLQATTRLAMHGSVLNQDGKAERLEAAEVPASVAGSDIEGSQVPTARLPNRAVQESSLYVGRCGGGMSRAA